MITREGLKVTMFLSALAFLLVGLVAAMIYIVGQAVIWGKSHSKQISVQPVL